MSRTLAASLLASESEEMRHLGEVINQCMDETHGVRVEYNELYDATQKLAEKASLWKRERYAYREALLNAVDIIDDWEDCDTKAQHTNTINDIEVLLWPGLPEGIAKLTREVLNGARSCEGGQCDPES